MSDVSKGKGMSWNEKEDEKGMRGVWVGREGRKKEGVDEKGEVGGKEEGWWLGGRVMTRGEGEEEEEEEEK